MIRVGKWRRQKSEARMQKAEFAPHPIPLLPEERESEARVRRACAK